MITSPLSTARFGSTFVLPTNPSTLSRLGLVMVDTPQPLSVKSDRLNKVLTVDVPDGFPTMDADRTFANALINHGCRGVKVLGPFARSKNPKDQKALLLLNA